MGASSGSEPRAVRATPEDLLAQSPWLRKLARSLVADASSADDLVQDAWVAALKSPPDGDRPLRPWLSRVVHNLVRTRHRADTTRDEREKKHAVHDHAPSASDSIESIDLQRVLLDAVEALPELQRSTVVRHYFKGLTSQEIARQDGVADSTVRWRLGQAIETLRHKLDARHGGDRNAWLSALLPLARRAELGVKSGSTTLVTSGVILMSMWLKVALGSIVLLAVVAAGWVLTRSASSGIEPLARASTGTVGELEPAAAPANTPDSKRVELPTSPVSAPAAIATNLAPDTAFAEARVLDARGRAIFGARLTCTDKVGTSEIEREAAPFATTDAGGRVQLALKRSDMSERHGRSKSMTAALWTETRFEVSASDKTTQTFSLDLVPGRSISLGDIVLADGGSIAGRIVDESGNSVPNADVRLILPDLTLEERDQVREQGLFQRTQKAWIRTGSDGSFAYHGVNTGFYRVWGNLDGWQRSVSEPFEVRAGETARVVDLVMPVDKRAIRGVVIGLDGKGVKHAGLEYPRDGSWIDVGTDENGAFVLNEIDTPTVDIYAHGLDRGFEGPDPGQALVPHVVTGTRELVIRLQPSAVIDVDVLDAEGNPVETVLLGALDIGGSGVSRGSTLQQRRLRALGKPFNVVVKATGYATKVVGPFQPDHPPERVTVVLERVAKVAGRVTVEGQPHSSADIAVCTLLPADTTKTHDGFPLRLEMNNRHWEWPREDGTFAFSIEHADQFVLVVQSGGFATFESEPFSVSPTLGKEDFEIALGHGGSLDGRVIGFTGSARDPSFVTLSHGFGSEVSSRISSDGTFAIANLTPGNWLMRLTHTDRPRNNRIEEGVTPDRDNRAVEIVEGKSTQVEMKSGDFAVPSVDGQLTLQGVDTSAWGATLFLSGQAPDKWSHKNSEHFGPDGEFHLLADEAGPHRLQIASPSTTERSDTIEQDIELLHGDNAWSLDAPTGSVRVPASESGELVLSWTSPGGARWMAHVRKSVGAQLTIDHVPAGTVRIEAGEQRTSDVFVRAGEVAEWR